MAGKQKLYLISLDAFGAEDLKYASTLPNFSYLLERSAIVEKVETVYPSLTYVAHTSITTGMYPKQHGVINNTLLQPKRESPDWHWYAKDIRVPTIFDVAHEAGYVIASFLWPVTGRDPSIKYNVAEIFANRPWQNQVLVSLYSSSLKFVFDLNRKFGKMRRGILQPELDEFLTACAVDTIEHKNPDLMAIHLVDLDSTRHKYGVDSLEARSAIVRMDNHLGQIFKAMEQKGILEDTVIAVFGDHYQINVETVIRLNAVFKEKGWITENKYGKIIEWCALAKAADGSCYIYTKQETDSAEVRKVLESFPDIIETIYNQEEAARLGADETCTFLVEARRGFYFRDESSGPFSEPTVPQPDQQEPAKPLHRATHGFSPGKEHYATTLLLSGPGINSSVRLPKGKLVDHAPTFLYALGLAFKHPIDGNALIELFEENKDGR